MIITRLIDEDPSLAQKVDLRAELKTLPAVSAGASSAASTEKNSGDKKKEEMSWSSDFGAQVQQLWALTSEVLRQSKEHIFDGHHWAVDQSFYYLIDCNGYLVKLSKPEGTGMPVVIDCNKEAELQTEMSLVYYKNKLYARKNDCEAEQQMLIFNAETLKQDTAAMEAIKMDEEDKAITIKSVPDSDKETGRRLQASRMFTDGKYFYVISTRKFIRPKDMDEDSEALPMASVIESFDPENNFKHVKSVTLVKNEQGDIWINKAYKSMPDEYDAEFIGKSYIATNGKNLIWVTRNGKIKIFDLETGVMLHHHTSKDYDADDRLISPSSYGNFYDVKTGGWFHIQKDEVGYNDVECYLIQDFKWDALTKVTTAESQAEAAQVCSNMSDIFKQQYLANWETPPNNNVVRRIMTGRKQPKDSGKAKAPLPADSANLIKATLLGFLASNCEKFNVRYQEALKSNTHKDHFIELFRFPYATYVTSEMFSTLSYFMKKCQNLRKQDKKQDTLASQHAFLYTLRILASNFKALSFCGIKLPEILDEEANYKDFLAVYQ